MFASDEVDNNLLLGKNSAFLLCNEGHMDRTLSCLTYMYLRSNVFSFPKILSYSIELCVRALFTNLLIVSSNPDGSIAFTLLEIFQIYFGKNIL